MWKASRTLTASGGAVVDGVRVAAERVESGLLDAIDEGSAADNGVQQTDVVASGLVTGQLASICVCRRDRRTGCSRRGRAAASRELSVYP
jgi:hypothetical protein